MSEVEERRGSVVSRERRVGVAVSVALMLGGGWWAASELTGEASTTETSYQVVGKQLAIDASDADIEIRSGAVSDIRVTRRSETTVFSGKARESYDDGRLELDGGCGILSVGQCGASYVIVVPKDVRVSVESSSGSLTAADLAAGGELKTASGDIDLRGAGGDTRLDTSSGEITATGLSAVRVQAKASSGDIELTFTGSPTSVEANSSSGDVDIHLPDKPGGYQVQATSSSGDEDVEVRTDPAAAGVIKAEASSGDVTVDYAAR